MAKFINPQTRIKVAGIGVISNGNLTDEMAQRLVSLNGKYAQLIDLENGKEKRGKSGGSKPAKKSGGEKEGGEKASSEGN